MSVWVDLRPDLLKDAVLADDECRSTDSHVLVPAELLLTVDAVRVGHGVVDVRQQWKRQVELVAKLEQAMSALQRADMKTFRKRVETVIAKLGHIR